ncbi:unnamed protein product [Absidia cylindrospora]
MTSSILLKKQEEMNARRVRDLLRLPENKKCFDCPIKSPFFVNVTLSTFICTRCSGLVREVGHRVKSISASTFTGPELTALELGGNGIASKIWLSGGYNTVDTPEPETDGEVRGFMRQKYYERKWLNYDLAVSHDLSVKDKINELFTEDGLPRQQQRRRRSTLESNTTNNNTMNLQQNLRLKKTIPTSLDLSTTNKVQPPTIQTAPLIMNSSQLQPKLVSPNPSKVDMISKTPDSQPVSPLPTQQPTSPMDSLFADLAGLTLSDTSVQTPSNSNHASGILTPTFLNKTNAQINDNTDKRHSVQPTTTYSAPRTMLSDDDSSASSHKRATSCQDIDPYSALRSHHTENQQRYQQTISAINAIAPKSSSSTSFHHNPTKKPNTNDPYAALRQLTHGPPERLNHSSPPITTINNNTTIPRSPVNTTTTWNSPPTPTKQQYHFELNQTPFDQDKSYSKKTDEWVQAGLQLACGHQEDDNDSDVMTQLSSSTATSSTTTTTTSHKTSKGNNINVFSDLDPLATYKQNKALSNS